MPEAIVVALVGNPNAGKSSLFNALSGLRQHVGNYAGVTVELKTASVVRDHIHFEIIDLPGTYSLAPRSPGEMVAVDLLLGRAGQRRPDVIVNVLDASNLDRHLYLTSQLFELGIPVILAVNMTDIAESNGLKLHLAELSRILAAPVVGLQANRGIGIDELWRTLRKTGPAPLAPMLPPAVVDETAALQQLLPGVPEFLVRRILLDVGGFAERSVPAAAQHADAIAAARGRLNAAGFPIPAGEAKARFGWVRNIVSAAVTKPAVRPVSRSDRIDRILTHRVWGTLFFLFVMAMLFQGIFAWAEPLKELLNVGPEAASKWLAEAMPAGPLRSLLIDGVIKGVGGIIVFLPQIAILYLFIAVLEDCGYMARAAFVMDRIMARCGLSGKSFIPLLSSVACAVPGILATRTIENRRDRLATILVAPLMSCSARLPVYALFTATFLTDGFAWFVPGLTLFGLYMIGFIAAPLVALLLKRTLLRGEPPVFVMELPGYKRPSLRGVLRKVYDACWAFIRRAGTVILAVMILVWAVLYFPTGDGNGGSYPERIAVLEEAKDDAGANVLLAEWKRSSYLGRVGVALEPAVVPLGWDWKLAVATLASFPAREVIVGTFGLLYEVGEVEAGDAAAEDNEKGTALRDAMKRDWAGSPARGKYAVPVALSVMVFFALCCQCASTLAVIRRETKSWTWPVFTFCYMTALAYLGAMLTYQAGRLISDMVG
jgi:ferrous iron transport protein B